MADNRSHVLCFGEVLWDCLPTGLFLGGAPLNVAYHLTRLGNRATMVSAVGRDFLGDQTRERMDRLGLSTEALTVHDLLHTGVVTISLDEHGDATYAIREPVAWDRIPLSDAVRDAAPQAAGVVYGSLASRHDANRDTLLDLLKIAGGLKVYDVNLRAPYDDPERVLALSGPADVLKVNGDELFQLANGDSPAKPSDANLEGAARTLANRVGVATVCITLGADGAALLHQDRFHRVPGQPVRVVDTVGAGDAFSAALTHGLIETGGHPDDPEALLARAVQLGSFVAGKPGAQPDYDSDEVFGKR
ncbi:MAG: carbohydrate kinase family protein [Opitutales bacterium]